MIKAISDKLSKADEAKLVKMYNSIVNESVHTDDEDDEDDKDKKELAKAKEEKKKQWKKELRKSKSKKTLMP